jgi:single-strand DNA-binding protein
MSVNKVILVGNVGKDPEVKYLDRNMAVAKFSLATSDPAYKNANGTEVPERTEWHNIVMWNRLAETAEKYVKKGSQLYIEGKIRTRQWEDKDGIKRYTTEIFADTMQFLGKRPEGGNQSEAQPSSYNTTVAEPSTSNPIPPVDSPVDDLPF